MTKFDPYKSSEDWDDDDEVLPETQDSPDQIRDFARFEAELYAEMSKVPLEQVLPDFLRRAEEMIAADRGTAMTYSLERLLGVADDFGVLADFEKIRAAILQRGYRSRQCKNGINFNLSSRRQLLYIAPARGGIRVGYLASNVPRLFGVSEEAAKDELGENWLTLEGPEALAKVTAWMEAIEVMKQRAIADA